MSGLGELLREELRDLSPYPAAPPEWGAVRLCSNENPLGPSPRALEALRRSLSLVHRYPDGSAGSLRQAIARRFGLTPRHVVLGNGSGEVLELAVRAVLRPGEEVVVSHPSFLLYRRLARAHGGREVVVPLRGFEHDLEALRGAISERTRLVVLDNPNNPTGTSLGRGELDPFVEELPPGVLLILDEAYAEYARRRDFPRSWEYVRRGLRVVVLRTFSKAYGLAGVRVGYGLAPPELAAQMDLLRQPFNVSLLAQEAALAALEDEDHLRRTQRLNASQMSLLEEGLREMGLRFVPSQANFLLVEVGPEAERVRLALQERGILVRSMAAYDLPHHLRITVGLPEENRRLLAALREVLRG